MIISSPFSALYPRTSQLSFAVRVLRVLYQYNLTGSLSTTQFSASVTWWASSLNPFSSNAQRSKPDIVVASTFGARSKTYSKFNWFVNDLICATWDSVKSLSGNLGFKCRMIFFFQNRSVIHGIAQLAKIKVRHFLLAPTPWSILEWCLSNYNHGPFFSWLCNARTAALHIHLIGSSECLIKSWFIWMAILMVLRCFFLFFCTFKQCQINLHLFQYVLKNRFLRAQTKYS